MIQSLKELRKEIERLQKLFETKENIVIGSTTAASIMEGIKQTVEVVCSVQGELWITHKHRSDTKEWQKIKELIDIK